jgi:hypothetical protein
MKTKVTQVGQKRRRKKSKKPKQKKAAAGVTKVRNDEEGLVASTLTSESATKPIKMQNDSPVCMTARERKALKKAKQKEKKAKEDDIDSLSCQSSASYPSLMTDRAYDFQSKRAHYRQIQRVRPLPIFVSLQYLDADAELRRFFGSPVVQATQTNHQHPLDATPERFGQISLDRNRLGGLRLNGKAFLFGHRQTRGST